MGNGRRVSAVVVGGRDVDTGPDVEADTDAGLKPELDAGGDGMAEVSTGG